MTGVTGIIPLQKLQFNGGLPLKLPLLQGKWKQPSMKLNDFGRFPLTPTPGRLRVGITVPTVQFGRHLTMDHETPALCFSIINHEFVPKKGAGPPSDAYPFGSLQGNVRE